MDILLLIMITLNICLSDLPKDKITTSEKNGKKYINLILWENKEPDKFGNTHNITVSKPKESTEPTVYVGNGKEFGKLTTSAPAPTTSTSDSDDLPF